MYVTTNSAVVWKRMADENRDSARLLAKAAGLFVLLLAAGSYAFSAQSSLGNVCSAIAQKSSETESVALSQLADSLLNGECA
jgi:hypothetical protein